MSRALLSAALILLVGCTTDEPAAKPDFWPWDPDGGRSDGLTPPRDGRQAEAKPGDAGAATPLELAAHWAPVWYQDTDSSNAKGDYIVAYDFDGDTRSDNNWENLTKTGVKLSAVIYYAVIETQTHWFIHYADFHPQDWDEDCQPIPLGPDRCHENDMEGATVIVRKDGTLYGKFALLYTEAHNTLHIFRNDPQVTAFNSKTLESVGVTFENGSHPELYVESKGHGVCGLKYSGSEHCKHPTSGNYFPGGDGVVYRYKGTAQTPTSGNDQNVGYDLVSLASTLWVRRKDICNDGCTFDQSMTYEGMTMGKAFDGDTHGDDKANPPWAWDDPDDGPVYRGDFFFRPAESALTHLKVPGAFSKVYVSNAFLGAP